MEVVRHGSRTQSKTRATFALEVANAALRGFVAGRASFASVTEITELRFTFRTGRALGCCVSRRDDHLTVTPRARRVRTQARTTGLRAGPHPECVVVTPGAGCARAGSVTRIVAPRSESTTST
nr:hypothetical protein GCM10025730_20520 [Promicromonospora thailandica]